MQKIAFQQREEKRQLTNIFRGLTLPVPILDQGIDSPNLTYQPTPPLIM